MAFQPLSLTEPGVSSPTFIGGACVAAGFSRPSSRGPQENKMRARRMNRFMAADSSEMQNAECRVQKGRTDLHSAFSILHSFVIHTGRTGRGEVMDDIERNDNGAEDDDQFEQMIIENS